MELGQTEAQTATSLVIREGGKVNIIEVFIPNDTNNAVKERDKGFKYQDLKRECGTSKQKCFQIPIRIGHTKIVKKGIEGLITKFYPNQHVYDLQNTAILDTTRLIGKTIG